MVKVVQIVNVTVPALVYNTMFHSANVLIGYQGYRPGNKLQHYRNNIK